MKPDPHLRAALRHAPDGADQAPGELGAQIVAAAYRAATEPAPRPPRKRWPGPLWFGVQPRHLGASGALASVLLAGVIGLMWQAHPPGAGGDVQTGDSAGPPSATTPAPSAVPAPTPGLAPGTAPGPSPAPAPGPATAAAGAAVPALAFQRRATDAAARRPALPAEQAERAARPEQAAPEQAEQRLQAAARLAAVPAQPLAAEVAAAAPPPALPTPPAPTPAPTPAPALAAPADAMPAPPAAVTAGSSTAAPPQRAAASRLAAAAPAGVHAPAQSLADSALPWAAVDTASATWRVQGQPVAVDHDWLASLAQLTRGHWAALPGPAPGPVGPAEPDLLWLQGGNLAGRLWLAPAQAVWCDAQAACQSAPLSEAAVISLRAGLQKKIPR